MRYLLAGATLALAACAKSSPPILAGYTAERCPVAPTERGYPVIARSASLDTATLGAIARSVAGNFTAKPDEREPPNLLLVDLNARVKRHRAYHRYQWTPREGDTATVLLLYRRGGPTRVARASGGAGFRPLAEGAVAHALQRAQTGGAIMDTLPIVLPTAAPDSAVVEIRFGEEPRAGDGLARFAVVEKPPAPKDRIVPRYPESQLKPPAPPKPGEVRVAFIIEADGSVNAETIRVLRATHQDFAEEAIKAATRTTYTPQIMDCAPVAEVVVQPYNFSIQGKTSFTIRPKP